MDNYLNIFQSNHSASLDIRPFVYPKGTG